MKTQQIGGWAALVNAGVAIGNLVVVFGVLGLAVAADPSKIAEFVVARPAPLLWLEFFKTLAACASFVIVYVIHQRLGVTGTQILNIAMLTGVASALLLLLAGLLGGIAILQGGYGLGAALLPAGVTYQGMNRCINGLGLAALSVNGLWLLGTCWVARQTQQLPPGLYYLGWLLGIASLLAFFLPPLALLVLLLGLIWSVWLGSVLLRYTAVGHNF